MNYNQGTFPNEERQRWEEKCPKCNEEFNKVRGGPQCQLGKCSDLDLQNEHEKVLPPMVIAALPPQYLVVDTEVPKDWQFDGVGLYDGNMGLSSPFSTPPWIKVPWYTCRIKGTFFDTVAHECGHITSYHAKTASGYGWYTSTTRRTMRKYAKVVKKGNSQRIEKFEQNPKYKSKLDYHVSEWNRKMIIGSQSYLEKGHEKTAWQNEYVKAHGSLMGSQFAWYNYQKNKPKQPWPSSVFWNDF